MALKTGSLVSSIIQKASTCDQKVIEDTLEKLGKKSSLLKGEIYDLVKQNYVNFDAYVNTTVALEQRVQEVRAEYQKIATRIEQDLNTRIAQSCDKREEVQSKLEETETRIALIQCLVDVYHAIEKSRAELQTGKYASAAGRLCNAAESLSNIAKDGCDAQVFRALKSELVIVISDLTFQLQEEWQKFISWSPKVIPGEPNLELLSHIELHVPVRSTAQENGMKEVIKAMKLLSSTGVWEQKIKNFSQRLLKLIVRPLIIHSTLRVSQCSSAGEVVLSMSKATDSEDTSIAELYDTLLNVLNVASFVVVNEYREEWMQKVGQSLCPEVEELVIAHRLSTSIPRSSLELDEYNHVKAQTRKFEEEIIKMGFAEQGKMCKMSEYADNVNMHFVAQKSQDILVHARSILTKPIHDTITLAKVDPFSKLAQILPNPAISQTDDFSDDSLGIDIKSLSFAFPKCSISSSVQEFVNYLYEILGECSQSDNPSASVQLFHSARNMVDLFCAVLPSYHSGEISEIPRVAAVQHNNCMYLAHHLITLGNQFHSKLSPPLNSQTTTFIDQVPFVRLLGEECFLSEMKKQSACLLDFLKSFGTFSGVSNDSQRESVRHSMQGALFHISKLSKVYLEVLPAEIHHKAIGGLLNAFVSEIIRMVFAMEDIAATDATELHSLLNTVIEKGPAMLLLTVEEATKDSLTGYCKNWRKLGELAMILNASLMEIVGFWDSGKGYLAKEFFVSEVRGLIKALFKNTEHRASALSKITL